MAATLAQLKLHARERADMVDDRNFVTPDELRRYINSAVADLYNILIDMDDAKIFSKNAPQLTDLSDPAESPGAYLLPLDFYRLAAVNVLEGTNYWPARPIDTANYAPASARAPNRRSALYELRTEPFSAEWFLYVFPRIAPANLAVVYIPSPLVLSLDTDQITLVNDDWFDFIAANAAIKMLSKQQMDTAGLEFEQKDRVDSIRDAFEDTDIGRPKQIRDLSEDLSGTWVFP